MSTGPQVGAHHNVKFFFGDEPFNSETSQTSSKKNRNESKGLKDGQKLEIWDVITSLIWLATC